MNLQKIFFIIAGLLSIHLHVSSWECSFPEGLQRRLKNAIWGNELVAKIRSEESLKDLKAHLSQSDITIIRDCERFISELPQDIISALYANNAKDSSIATLAKDNGQNISCPIGVFKALVDKNKIGKK